MSLRATAAAVTAFALSACGARTGLPDDQAAIPPDEDASDVLPDAAMVTFDAGCREPLWLLFNVRDDRKPSTAIYAMRADGTAAHAVKLPHSPTVNASVSPDGSKLLHTSFMTPDAAGNDSTLYLYDFASGRDTAVVETSGLTYSALSPDGNTVSYVSNYSLRAVDVNGSHDRLLIAGPNGDGSGYGHPVFETDSLTVVYATGGIMGAIRSDGSGMHDLLDALPGSFQYPNPAFSPDHQRIAVGLFCSQSDPDALRVFPFASLPGAVCQSGQILTMVSDGSSPNSANDPSWGTNGLIAYASGSDVFVIPEGGGAPTNMTGGLTGDAGAVTASDPVWAPGCAVIPQ